MPGHCSCPTTSHIPPQLMASHQYIHCTAVSKWCPAQCPMRTFTLHVYFQARSWSNAVWKVCHIQYQICGPALYTWCGGCCDNKSNHLRQCFQPQYLEMHQVQRFPPPIRLCYYFRLVSTSLSAPGHEEVPPPPPPQLLNRTELGTATNILTLW